MKVARNIKTYKRNQCKFFFFTSYRARCKTKVPPFRLRWSSRQSCIVSVPAFTTLDGFLVHCPIEQFRWCDAVYRGKETWSMSACPNAHAQSYSFHWNGQYNTEDVEKTPHCLSAWPGMGMSCECNLAWAWCVDAPASCDIPVSSCSDSEKGREGICLANLHRVMA